MNDFKDLAIKHLKEYRGYSEDASIFLMWEEVDKLAEAFQKYKRHIYDEAKHDNTDRDWRYYARTLVKETSLKTVNHVYAIEVEQDYSWSVCQLFTFKKTAEKVLKEKKEIAKMLGHAVEYKITKLTIKEE